MGKTKAIMQLFVMGGVMAIASVKQPGEMAAMEIPSPQALVAQLPADETTSWAIQTYDELNIPVQAEYPDTMHVQGVGSNEGVGVLFSFNTPAHDSALNTAQVHVFLPTGIHTAAGFEPFILGERGFLDNNGWTLTSSATSSSDFPYPWVKQVIFFESPQQQRSGAILLGETMGQGVRVTLLHPNQKWAEFWSSAQMILDSLRFKAESLPLRPPVARD